MGDAPSRELPLTLEPLKPEDFEPCDFCDQPAMHFDRDLNGLCDACFKHIADTQPESGLWN
jgi:hypothetical protein